MSLVWMRHRRGLNNNINNTHKRTLRYTIHFLSRQKIIHYTLFIKTKIKFTGFTTEGQICVYPHKNIQYLATEICKVKNSLSPEIMKAVVTF